MTKTLSQSLQHLQDVQTRLLTPSHKSKTSFSASQSPSPRKVLIEEIAEIKVSVKELFRKQDELDRRAAELEAREQSLRENPGSTRSNNFPPLPKTFPFKPCFYQDINVEIPLDYQKIVRSAFYLWVFYSLLLVANLSAGVAVLIAKNDAMIFKRSIRSIVLNVPLSYLCWFRPLYKAFRNNSSLNFIMFFLIFAIQVGLSIAAALGITRQGIISIPIAIAAFNQGKVFGFILTVIAIGQALFAAASMLLMRRVHSLYRGAGGSINCARAEFRNEVLNNTYVQQAAATVVKQVGDIGQEG
ncbi:secretory carrier-associated membrane protein 5-like isoform X1 [Varroa jacobsoni]|uniref:secretory carrier-associated membrane protein 5-like isoform X1 n=2 Tax=Varroa jacobsoni TaxID=62625 RepID=UPI000BF2D25F|nr:secretory carrier-associated membrane protein 5-like isoform X1 [Varroa jacobsoni]